jgi:hypothetical protein
MRRWTIGRVATDLAIIMVAVPYGLNLLAPSPRGGCGMTPEFYASSLGLLILGIRPTWLALKALNDAAERWLARVTDPKFRPKSLPMDDF